MWSASPDDSVVCDCRVFFHQDIFIYCGLKREREREERIPLSLSSVALGEEWWQHGSLSLSLRSRSRHRMLWRRLREEWERSGVVCSEVTTRLSSAGLSLLSSDSPPFPSSPPFYLSNPLPLVILLPLLLFSQPCTTLFFTHLIVKSWLWYRYRFSPIFFS